MSDQNKPDPKPVEVNIKARLAELTNVSRIISNGLNVVIDAPIKGGHAGAVAEFLHWLTGFNQSVTQQIKTLEATLPKPEPKKAIVPKVVTVPTAGDAATPKPVDPKPQPAPAPVKA